MKTDKILSVTKMFIIVFHCPMRVCVKFGANRPTGGALVAV